jgi:Cu/Ag efflux pump CusA
MPVREIEQGQFGSSLGLIEGRGTTMWLGDVHNGQQRFLPAVRLLDKPCTDSDALAVTLTPTAAGTGLPLNQLAKITEIASPFTINRDRGKR